ncbi:MAG: hypothetical protein AAB038_03260 [Planctomycetota bacterium]
MKISEGLWYGVKRLAIPAFVLGATVFLLLIIHRKVYAHYAIEPQYQINLAPLEVLAAPDWCNDPSFEDAIRNSMKLEGQISIFDKDLIPRLLAKYENNPWVARVDSIEKQFPNKLNVKLELRRPVVVVELKKWNNRSFYYLVDKDSVRIPGEYYTVPNLPITLPIVVGVRNSPPMPGQRWQDQGLTDAIDVAGAFKQYDVYQKLDIAAIDITNSGGRRNKQSSEIVILTGNHTQIEWGRPVNTDKPFELSAAEKIKNLCRVLEVSPQLQGIKVVKVQFDQPYIVLQEPVLKKTNSAGASPKRTR